MLQIFVLSGLSIGVFAALGAEIALTIGILWFFGALPGGIGLTHLLHYFDSPNFYPKEFYVAVSAFQGIDSPEIIISGTNGLNAASMNMEDFMSRFLAPSSCKVSVEELKASLK